MKRFDIVAHLKQGFTSWVREEFPDLKSYANGQGINYPELESRVPEIYATTTIVLENIAKETHAEESREYLQRRDRFEKLFLGTCSAEPRDWRPYAQSLEYITGSMERDLRVQND